jgi:hypothetical protein
MTPIAIAITTVLAVVAAADVPGLDPAKLQPMNAKIETVTWKGAPAVKMAQVESAADALAIVKGQPFHNGTIDLDVAGLPGASASDTARGFVGVSFRISADGSKMETLYIRPTNGRAADQLRRNHSVQYVSRPDWPWERLRKETPGVYESYADMQPGEWIHLKIVVKGTELQAYVGSATQPALLVHDLKLGDVTGGIALWIGPGTDGYFKDLRIAPDAGV